MVLLIARLRLILIQFHISMEQSQFEATLGMGIGNYIVDMHEAIPAALERRQG